MLCTCILFLFFKRTVVHITQLFRAINRIYMWFWKIVCGWCFSLFGSHNVVRFVLFVIFFFFISLGNKQSIEVCRKRTARFEVQIRCTSSSALNVAAGTSDWLIKNLRIYCRLESTYIEISSKGPGQKSWNHKLLFCFFEKSWNPSKWEFSWIFT